MSDQTELHGRLAHYATGALTQAELIVFDDHLQRCPDCQFCCTHPRQRTAETDLEPDRRCDREELMSRLNAATAPLQLGTNATRSEA